MQDLLRPSEVTAWFARRYGQPTPAQAAAWPLFEAGHHLLILSPTGTGKTLAAFLGVLNQLAREAIQAPLPDSIQAIYISPLRALSYDLEKNLQVPLQEIYGSKSPIRVGLRSGDTSTRERQQQFSRPPHILLTTPESLSLLLTQTKWLEVLKTVRWLIVDEVHALAENKRGAHLSLTMERLQALVEEQPGRSLQRLGLSATVAPAEEVAHYLVGTDRPCKIVDVAAAKKIELAVYSPLSQNPYPQSGFTGVRLIKELARLIEENRTTLIFTNTRSGAESATYWLHQALPGWEKWIECHHASLDRDVRQEVEDRLKAGELRAVVCSTSLELGIDIGAVDLVVMLSTPKGVSKALQRTGRAGHNIHSVSRGLIMATNVNDLVESCATVLLARQRSLDQVRLPQAPLDVLAQHLASMGCLRAWEIPEAFQLVHRAYPFRKLSFPEFQDVLDYLAGGGKSLRAQYTDVFGKIELSDQRFITRGGKVQRDLLQNMGTIPSEGMMTVRLKRQVLGTVEETFVRRLQPGDVFSLGGRPVRLEKVGWMECFVRRADKATPTVPRWNANKMPLSNRVAQEIVRLRGEIRDHFSRGENQEKILAWLAERLECGPINAGVIYSMFAAQQRVSEIPAPGTLLVEEFFADPSWLESGESPPKSDGPAAAAPQETPAKTRRRNFGMQKLLQSRAQGPALHYFFHSVIGRSANDALSRIVATRISRLRGGNAVASPDDYGFVLTVAPDQAITLQDLPALLGLENLEADLDHSLKRSELLKYHFRNAAQTGLMVYRNYFGEQKSVRKLQWSAEVIFNVLQQYEPDHVLMREARREAQHSFLDLEGAAEYLRQIGPDCYRWRQVHRVPPLSFALFATKIKEALLVEDPREMIERLFHHWWAKLQHEE